MIHIEHYSGREAATEALEHMRERGGAWLIWSAADEGFLMTPEGSARASVIHKHWADVIVGTFTADVSKAHLVREMRDVRRVALLPARIQRMHARLTKREYIRSYMRRRRGSQLAEAS